MATTGPRLPEPAVHKSGTIRAFLMQLQAIPRHRGDAAAAPSLIFCIFCIATPSA